MRQVCAVVLLMWSTAALAEPRSAKDCAAIEESFAYNECIAKFGPKANATIVRPDPGAVLANAPDVPTAPSGPAPASGRGRVVPAYRAAPTRVSGTIVQRRANGRVFAEFRVGAPVARAPVAKARAVPQRRYAGYGRRRYR